MDLDGPEVRKGLTDLLSYPCHWIIHTIDEAGCRFRIEYDERNPCCRECSFGSECRWLGSHDTLRSLNRIPCGDLLDALRFARGVITARLGPGHNSSACVCADCRWLRQGRRFMLNIGQSPG